MELQNLALVVRERQEVTFVAFRASVWIVPYLIEPLLTRDG
ncbi:MAG TPA: hypothetical protein VFE62_25780 [Gemmataceae bacterium]|nr:hypothetical protein [Gemmataceae bacterium]